MKSLFIILLFGCPIISFSQAAEIFFYNQKASVSQSNEDAYFSGGNYQTQAYTNNAGYYDFKVVLPLAHQDNLYLYPLIKILNK